MLKALWLQPCDNDNYLMLERLLLSFSQHQRYFPIGFINQIFRDGKLICDNWVLDNAFGGMDGWSLALIPF